MNHFQTMTKVLLDGFNPYHGYEYKQGDTDCQGWNSDHPIFKTMIQRLVPKTIIEVGSWKGASARHMADLSKAMKLDNVILCVDTWLGDEVLWNNPEWRQSLKLKHGRPNVYHTFMANTLQHSMEDRLLPISMPSVTAAKYLAARGVTSQMVYIDADHTFHGALADMEAYWTLLQPNGVMIVDDFIPGSFEDVVMAIEHFSISKKIDFHFQGEKAWMFKI